MTCLVEKTIATLVKTIIKKLVNLDIAVSLIMTNLQPSTQKIEPLGMLKQSLILLNK
ncbi:hypothetical protein Goshw_004218 [Gossypium schwendimanii]|uniref:Uncharacterized protein n=1 Tax=Gossypium schwendimanii TaxID=34291 RepID=A0A7J9NAQ7_GOSSC|nr:hypothetical protein [Gossypium schwendimanii]